MFDCMVPMTPKQVQDAADALQAGNPVMVCVDPKPVFVVFLSSTERGLPYEVDYACLDANMKPVGITAAQRRRLAAWTKPAVDAICLAWKERHPEA